jgi:AcrR family transcriptional regulator
MAGDAQAGKGIRMSVSATQPRATTGRGGSKQRLLETAERMLAEYGIEGVSLRQIGAATGEGNKSVIQYHFGDKAGLIREIILRRVETFEARRQQLLVGAIAKNDLADTRTLLEILFLPLAEAVDADGRHGYARFMAQFITRFQYQDGIAHPGWAPLRTARIFRPSRRSWPTCSTSWRRQWRRRCLSKNHCGLRSRQGCSGERVSQTLTVPRNCAIFAISSLDGIDRADR